MFLFLFFVGLITVLLCFKGSREMLWGLISFVVGLGLIVIALIGIGALVVGGFLLLVGAL